MKKLFMLIVTSVLLLGVLAACSQGSSSGDSQKPSKDKEDDGGQKKYAFIFKNTGNPYGEKMMDGFEEAIKELMVRLFYVHQISLLQKRKFKLLSNLLHKK